MSKCKTHNEYLAVCNCKEPDKGLKNGSCNRQSCQQPGATWFNRGTDAWYCQSCALRINASPFMLGEPPLCSYQGPLLDKNEQP
jgi:hypothetical protein